MAFKKYSFDEALGNGTLDVRLEGRTVSRDRLGEMTAAELQAAQIKVYGGELRIRKTSYTHWLSPGSLPIDDPKRELIRANPTGLGLYWRSLSIGTTPFPEDPHLPTSNALDFLRNAYESTAGLLTDDGKLNFD